jgi:gluconate 5-dehydrogenase
VAITARREPGLREAQQHLQQLGIRALAVPCDISSNDAVQAAVERIVSDLGEIDILFNNAGATWGAPFAEIPLEAWDKVIRTNVDGTFFVTRAVALRMIDRGQGGRIVNIGSVAGLRGQRDLQALPYSTSKGAIISFTRDLAVKLAQHQITVNCICPGWFPTRMSAGVLEGFGEQYKQQTPLGRLGGEHDLQGIAVFLASPASAYITGQIIAVDGGLTAQ